MEYSQINSVLKWIFSQLSLSVGQNMCDEWTIAGYTRAAEQLTEVDNTKQDSPKKITFFKDAKWCNS